MTIARKLMMASGSGGGGEPWYPPSSALEADWNPADPASVMLVGNFVSALLDTSANARHMTQGNAFARPTYADGVISVTGRQFLANTAASISAIDELVFCFAASVQSTWGQFARLFGGAPTGGVDNSSDGAVVLERANFAQAVNIWRRNITTPSAAGYPIQYGQTYIFTSIIGVNGQRLRVDGVDAGESPPPSAIPLRMDHIRFFARAGGSGGLWSGALHRGMITNDPSMDAVQKLEGLIRAAVPGATLDPSHPYANFAP